MSTQVTTLEVKELRDATGISVVQCRNALIEAEGDMKKALAILKKTSSDIALKKSSRELKDGAVALKIENLPAQAGKKGVLVSLLCETDFVGRNEDFTAVLLKLLDKAFILGVDKMKTEAKDMIDSLIQKTGENIELGDAYEIQGETLGGYVHNNKIAIMVSLKGGNSELAKDVAMHIAAMKPEYITPLDIDEETRKTMFEIFQKEITGIDKPEEIKKKMLEGKINTYFKEKTLLDQPFIKDGDITVGKLLEKENAKIKEVKRYSI